VAGDGGETGDVLAQPRQGAGQLPLPWATRARNVRPVYACALLLCTAVAITWYGPAKDDPQVEISLSNGTVRCGKADTIGSGKLTLKTSSGSIPLDLQQIVGLRAVDSCTPKKSQGTRPWRDDDLQRRMPGYRTLGFTTG
jgi:hypothetical protein